MLVHLVSRPAVAAMRPVVGALRVRGSGHDCRSVGTDRGSVARDLEGGATKVLGMKPRESGR